MTIICYGHEGYMLFFSWVLLLFILNLLSLSSDERVQGHH